jgi:hypothetical protein
MPTLIENKYLEILMPHNNRMQTDFGKLRFPQPLMRSVIKLRFPQPLMRSVITRGKASS